MNYKLAPLAVTHWIATDAPPRFGRWRIKTFHDTQYVEAWEYYMRRKFEGHAVYLFFRGERQAEANIVDNLEPLDDGTIYDEGDVA